MARQRKMRFEVYRDRAGEFRWRLVASNGRKVADSGEGYKRRPSARAAVSAFSEAVFYLSPVVDVPDPVRKARTGARARKSTGTKARPGAARTATAAGL